MVLRLTALVFAVATCTYFGIKGDSTFFIMFALLSVFIFFQVFSLHKRGIKKIEYMFDAIDSNDLSFQYFIGLQSSDDRVINEFINRIIRTLLRIRIDTIKNENFYEQIIDAVNIGIIVIDNNGYILRKNYKALQFLGIPSLTHVKQIRRVNEELATHLTNLESDNKFNFSYETEQGNVEICVNISLTTLQNKNIFIVTFSDINNEMDNKELDSWIRLIRVMTHEIMNSITPITSISDTLLSKHEYKNEEIKNGLEVISKTGKGLMTFVESYRRFTHIPDPKPTLFYVKDFLERMVILARHNADDDSIDWQTEVLPEDMILYADENLISLVMINLLKNAHQAIICKKTYSDENSDDNKDENEFLKTSEHREISDNKQVNENENNSGLISIKASCNESESIIIEISNNGSPIPEEEAAHIFIPFFTTKEKGSGVGLSIARQIMRLSGGSITLKKASLTGITTFVLTFP